MINLRRSLVINFFTSTGATVVQFGVSLLLARLLLPGEIGVFSMTVVFVNIAHVFRDFGIGTYLMREAELTPEKIRSAMGVLYTSSWLIAVLLFFASPWIAGWFHEPQMTSVMRVLSVGFIFIPFGSVTHSLLNRSFEAGKQARVAVISTFAYAIACLSLAYLGFGAMSLAYANLVNILVTAIAYIPYRPANLPYRPSFRNWGSILHFGVGTLLSNCANQIAWSVPDMLLGKLSGARNVGLLSRANSTVSIFSHIAGSTVNYGAMSYVSQTHHRGESLTPLLNRATALLTGTAWPVLGVTAVLGNEIVIALYGDKWLESAAVVPLLALAAAVGMAFNYIPTALTALGRPFLSAFPTAVTIAVRIAAGILLFDGTLISFAWAICLASILTAPVIVWQQRHYLGYHTRSMLGAIMPSLMTTATCMLMAEIVRFSLPMSMPALAVLAIASVPITAVWYLTLRWSKHPLVDEVHHFASGFKMRLMPS